MIAPSEKKTFPSLVVASAATGIVMTTGFRVSTAAEIFEHVLGHQVWTHEIPGYSDAVRAKLFEQFPQMPSPEAASADWKAAASAMLKTYGIEVSVLAGFGERDRNPIDTLADIVGAEKIIVVQT